MAWDTRVTPTEVGIQVKNGVVTLTGNVDSWAKRSAAEHAAHQVKGVLDVSLKAVRVCLLVSALFVACHARDQKIHATSLRITEASATGPAASEDPPEAKALREHLVRRVSDKVHDKRVLGALRRVPRHLFVPGASLSRTYANIPLPIGHDQTISQPAAVAVMSEALELRGAERVLEIGTGSGYQAAILSVLAKEVYTIELVPALGETARERLARLGYANVHVLVGDGYRGWPKYAPFDRVLVTAAPTEVPVALLEQLAVGGVLVAPVGPSPWDQHLLRYRKTTTGTTVEDLGLVAFVPMVRGD